MDSRYINQGPSSQSHCFLHQQSRSLTSFLNNIIQKSISPPSNHVLNSFQLIKKLFKVKLEEHYEFIKKLSKVMLEHYELISLDVVSLFTNIPLDLAIAGIRERWRLISSNTNIPLEQFVLALKLVLNSTCFTFNRKIYKQTFGISMNSPLSPIISDVTLS